MQENKIAYDGKTSELFGIWIVNVLLKVVTLGVYTFWGKTRIRRYVVGSFALSGDRFEYTGTGLELFLGFLKALPIIILAYMPLVLLNEKQHPALHFLGIFPIFYLIFVGLYSAMRYRFSRTTWRGVRGKLTGSALKYGLGALCYLFLNGITLGFMSPYFDLKLKKYMLDNCYFGSVKASFNPSPSKLVTINIVTLLLAIPTLFISRLWYRAALDRHIYDSLMVDTLRFRCGMTGGNLLGLIVGNIFILIFTLGLGMPFIIQRQMRYTANMLTILGDLNSAKVLQSDEKLGKSGEGVDMLVGTHDIGFM